MNSDLYLRIDDLRAIAHAEINLNGISVIAGENGSGKSTISKLVYTILRSALKHDDLIDAELKRYLSLIIRYLRQLSTELNSFSDGEKLSTLRNVRNSLNIDGFGSYYNKQSSMDLLEVMSEIEQTIEQLIEFYKNVDSFEANPAIERKFQRIKWLILSELEDSERGESDTLEETLTKLKRNIPLLFEDFEKQKEDRPVRILEDLLSEAFYDAPLSENFNLYELNVPVIDRDKKRTLPVNLINHVVYIDTPMTFGIKGSIAKGRDHWEHLNESLNERYPGKRSNSIQDVVKDTLQGEVSSAEDQFPRQSFVYKRKDGRAFDLLECATGLKSFAVLQLLAKNGVLSDKTLLIIDEPEAHLHPQWVVEYARLVILLHKTIGVKFLIASHHPDMISALKYIGEKEGTSDLNFYLSSPSDADPYQYTYKNLGKDIEPIFSSFNIALDRIDQYGSLD